MEVSLYFENRDTLAFLSMASSASLTTVHFYIDSHERKSRDVLLCGEICRGIGLKIESVPGKLGTSGTPTLPHSECVEFSQTFS